MAYNLEETIASVVNSDEEGHIWEGKTFDVAQAVREYMFKLIEESEGDADYIIWWLKK